MWAVLLGSVSLVLFTTGGLYVLLSALALWAGRTTDPRRAQRGIKVWGSVATVGLAGCLVSLFILR